MNENLPSKKQNESHPSIKKLKDELENINLPQELINEIGVEEVKKSLIETVFSLIPGGQFITKLNQTSETIEEKLNQAKLEYLLSHYIERNESVESAVNNLNKIFSDPFAFSIYSKIIKISNESILDEDLLKILANVLHNLSKADIESQFEDIKFVLSQIEQIPVQSLVVIRNLEENPTFYTSTVQEAEPARGMLNDFSNDLAFYYLKNQNFDEKYLPKIELAVKVLRNNDFVRATFKRPSPSIEFKDPRTEQKVTEMEAFLSDTGKLLVKYLK